MVIGLCTLVKPLELTAMRYYFLPISVAILKILEMTSAGEHVEKLEPFVHCWWAHKMIWPLRKTVWCFLKTLTME